MLPYIMMDLPIFSLCIKCSHLGKKRRRLEEKQVFFSNNVSSSGPSKYVKCGYCSDFYLRGMSNFHNCFLRRSDLIFGDEKRGPIRYMPKMSFIMT